MTAHDRKQQLQQSFASVTEWVFDLDNTLYPRHCDLFAQIDWKMTDYVSDLLSLPKDEARKLQKDLYPKSWDHAARSDGALLHRSTRLSRQGSRY